MRTTSTSSTSASVTSAGTSIATGVSAASTAAATTRCVEKRCTVRQRKATCASRYATSPPSIATAIWIFSASSTCSSDFLKPRASSTMPAIIGRCRKEKESRAISLRSRPGAACSSRRAATSATTSKYSHHSAAEMNTPTTAATTLPVTSPSSAPTPIATIDSPSAMMMMRPWRSAKCSGSSFQPSAPNSAGPPMSSARASSQSPPCTQPSVNDATAMMPTPSAVLIASPVTDVRNPGSPREARPNRTMWAIRTTARPPANSSP